ncbi:MAG: DUF434 domain-containing protein [Salinibacter sp.]
MASSRGAHPEDPSLFAPSERPALRAAVRDLSWLRTRGYGDDAAQNLVGDHYRLTRRQRNAVGRSACGDADAAHRRVRRRRLSALAGEWIEIDGFNVLITLEGALGGAYSFIGRDGAYRDVSPVQGTYRPVDDTERAIRLVRAAAHHHRLEGVVWRLDDHVSNVGRLKARLDAQRPDGLGWEIRVLDEVDRALMDSDRPVATSDSRVLDAVRRWCVLERAVIALLPEAPHVCDLRPPEEPGGRIGPPRP